MTNNNTTARNLQKIDKIRQIVASGSRAKVEGTMVDLFTAGAIVAVYDRLNDTCKELFVSNPITNMAHAAIIEEHNRYESYRNGEKI